MSAHSQAPEKSILGVWWLKSRLDTAKDGTLREEPNLGSDPLGILTYAPGRFAAQFMKRNRTGDTVPGLSKSGMNNTSAVGGYDAYFGTYEVHHDSGEVLHRLEGALSPENVGLEVYRNLEVKGDRLEIRLATATADGEAILRTLTWDRIG